MLRIRALVCVLFGLLASCGSTKLPAFANPPPYDAGPRPDAGAEDAG